jgi:hypothetical protein
MQYLHNVILINDREELCLFIVVDGTKVAELFTLINNSISESSNQMFMSDLWAYNANLQHSPSAAESLHLHARPPGTVQWI